MSGFFPCVGGTQLNVVVGGHTNNPAISFGGGGYAWIEGAGNRPTYGGGFSGVFTGTYDPSTCLVLAGGGGGTGLYLNQTNTYMANGGGGGWPEGAAPFQTSTNGSNVGPSVVITGGTQTAGGRTFQGNALSLFGSRWFGGQQNTGAGTYGPGGGGWFGGGMGAWTGILGTMLGGGGGSSYFDPTRITSVAYESGTTYTQLVIPTQALSLTLAPAGGQSTLASFGLSNVGNGNQGTGAVVMMPYVGTAGNCKVGVDARLMVL